jgi:hypothetical protein
MQRCRLLLALAIAGCGSGANTPDHFSVDLSATAGPDMAACNAVANAAPAVTVTGLPGPAPAPKGGPAPPDGTYYVTSAAVYGLDLPDGGASLGTYQSTSMVSGSTYNVATNEVPTGKPVQMIRENGTLMINGTSAVATPSCPPMAPYTNGWEGDGVKIFTLQFPPTPTGQQLVVTFNKQ